MSGIEKTCLLTLALQRIKRHGDLYLSEQIETPELKNAIKSIREACEKIEKWDSFVENASDFWVDLRDNLADIIYDKIEIVKCKRCGRSACRRVVEKDKKTFLCERCFKDWEAYFKRILHEIYDKNFEKWVNENAAN